MKKTNVFTKIDKYLFKKGHELVMSIYLSNYNGNNIYVRFDYVRKLEVYKIVWYDLNFIDERHIEDYTNMQMVTKFLATKLLDIMNNNDVPNSYDNNPDIKGDRVEILCYFNEPREYIFDRFLPLDWEFLIDPIILMFTYLPRGMDVFLNEMFAKFDGREEYYNSLKPIKYDIFKQSEDIKHFKEKTMDIGRRYYDLNHVTFIEKQDNQYIAIVEDVLPNLVTITEEGGFVKLWCNCKSKGLCKHIYATILAIRNNDKKPFYKVRYIGKEESLLEKVTVSNFYLCFGVENDKLLIITAEGIIFPADIIQKGKVVFEVIEDDDDLSLSKIIDSYRIK